MQYTAPIVLQLSCTCSKLKNNSYAHFHDAENSYLLLEWFVKHCLGIIITLTTLFAQLFFGGIN